MSETPESSSPDDEAAKAAYREKLRSLAWGRVPGGSRQGNYTLRRNHVHASWENGIKSETRPDGSVMPYLNERGEPIRMKDWSENRHKYEATLDKIRQPSEE